MNTQQPNEWVINYVLNKLSVKYPDITREEVIREWQEMNGFEVKREVKYEGEMRYAKVV